MNRLGRMSRVLVLPDAASRTHLWQSLAMPCRPGPATMPMQGAH